MQCLKVDDYILEANFVITAEGSLGGLTLFGKVPAGIARGAKENRSSGGGFVGPIANGTRLGLVCGSDAFVLILPRLCLLREAMSSASKLLKGFEPSASLVNFVSD